MNSVLRSRVARRGIAAVALAAATAIGCPAFGASGTWTGAGTDPNWDDASNWSGGIPSATTDTATFSGTPTTNNFPTLDVPESIGELVFGTTTGGWTLNGSTSNTLTLNATGTDAGIGINALAQTSGTTTINAALNVAANQTWEFGGGTFLFNGDVSGAGPYTVLTITNSATGNITFTAANDFGGYLTLNSGTLQLSGAGTMKGLGNVTAGTGSNGITLAGGTFVIDNSGPAANAISNRLSNGSGTGSASNILFSGGSLTYNGNSSVVVSEALGAATIGTGAASGLFSVNSTNGANFNLLSLNRSTQGADLFVNGASLGTGSGGQILLGSQPAVSGTTTVGGTDNPAVKNALIVPFLVGEISTGTSGAPAGAGAVGTAYGTANTFVTAYPAAGGLTALRPLNPTDEFTNNSIVSGNNTYITAATNLSTSNDVNSLVINGGDLSIADGQTLTNNSGALMFVTSNTIKGSVYNGSNNPGQYNLGPSEGIVYTDAGVTGQIAALLSGNTPLTVNGPGTLALTNLDSNYGGAVAVNQGTLQFGNGTAGGDATLASNAIVNVFANGAAAINNVAATPLPFQIILNTGANLFINTPTNTTVPLNVSAAGAAQFISFNNTGDITVTASGSGSAIDVPAAAVNTFLIFNGGPVNVAGPITSETLNSQYFYDRTSSPITLSNAANNIAYSAKFYMQAINGSTSAGVFPNESVTIPADASFSTALTSTSRNVYITNENNNINTGAPGFTNELPPPVTFNVNGSMTTYIVYLGGYTNGGTSSIGQTTLNISGTPTAQATLNADLYTSFIFVTMPNTVMSSVNIGPYATVSSNAAGSGFGNKISIGGYTHVGVVGPNTTMKELPVTGDTGFFWLGDGGDSFMEIGGPAGAATVDVSDGSASGANSTSNGLIFNEAGTATAVMNVYNNGTLNWQPAVASDLNFKMGIVTGSTSVLNVIGGLVTNSGYNSSIQLGHVAGANAILNLNADSSGNVGKVVTSYVNSGASNTSAFINFNGGELEYSDVPSSSTSTTPTPQTNFVPTSVAGGIYVYSKGAIIGTDGNNFAPSTTGTNNDVVLNSALLAPPTTGLGGITQINVTAQGTGYASPPLVVITDPGGTGKDATAYATINSAGQVTGVVVTSAGFGYDANTTVTFVDGGAPGAAGASYPFTAATASPTFGTSPLTGGGLTKVDNLTLSIGASANTYTGPTVIKQGILVMTASAGGASTITNTIPNSPIIVVGDTPANGSQSTTVNYTPYSTPATLTTPGPAGGAAVNGAALFTRNGSSLGLNNNIGGFVLAQGQVLSGFGTVMPQGGNANQGFTIGGFSTSNPVQSTISPGITLALPVPGSTTNATESTALGDGANMPNTTGTLTVHTGGATPADTIFGSGGTYYWKLDMSTGGTGATSTPGTVTTAGSAVNGASWDALVLDLLQVNSTNLAPFNIQMATINTGNNGTPVNFNSQQAYSWTIARVGTAQLTNGTAGAITGNGLAALYLNTSNVPAPGTFTLSQQADPTYPTDIDLVVSYAPAPEPTALLTLTPAAAAMFLRRRRRAAAKEAQLN